MKRICAISLFFLLASCTPAQNATPANQTAALVLKMPAECRSLEQGLCLVSEPGEYLGEGKTIVITQKPEAAFLENSTALQVKIEDWTLIFDPGDIPFSVGMTFLDAKLYPQGQNVSMAVENNGKKCDTLEGAFTDEYLNSGETGNLRINPVTAFDIEFALRCNGGPQAIQGRVKLPL
jgi:hypothetical protein